jgi:hypothetical protein
VADPRARPTVRPQRLALGVLARASSAKTHLCPPLTPEGAAELCAALLTDTLNALAILPMGFRAVLCTSETEADALRKRVPQRWQVVPAESERLEERLNKGLSHLFASGAEGAAILSSNAPLMPLDELFEGMLWLTKRRRLLLGPTTRGGLYLVGATQTEPALFKGLDWSDKDLADRVQARAKELDVETLLLKPTYEIEEPADLERLAQDLGAATTAGLTAPTCTALLARLGIQKK